MNSRQSAHSTTEQLRHDIDSGRTGDKIDWPDPAAAPLGTDAEAGGAPPSHDEVALARWTEGAGTSHVLSHWRGLGAAWILIGFIILLGVALLSYLATIISL
jgi:hypothetical protein